MAQVTYNSIKRYRYYGQDDSIAEDDKAREPTLRDKILRQVLDKQSKTDLAVDDFFRNRKKFKSGMRQEDVNHSLAGLLTNQSFKQIKTDHDIRELLVSCGLEAEEIEVLLCDNHKREKESDEAYLKKLKVIELKLQQRQNYLENDSQSEEGFSGAVELSRREYEEECCRVASSDAADKLTSCLIRLKPQQDTTVHPDHPIHSLQDLEKELFPPQEDLDNSPDVSSYSNKSCPSKHKQNEDINKSETVKFFQEKPETFWDMKERPVILTQKPTKEPAKVYGCQTPKSFNSGSIIISKKRDDEPTTQDLSKSFVWKLDSSKLVPLETIKSGRMTLEQIVKEPKFQKYKPGTPSPTLYVKNLPHKLSPVSIVSLFGHFEEENGPKIEYRLLKGKMKGQAFVKFGQTQTAVKAFDTINGYVLEGKPILLEYSKKVT